MHAMNQMENIHFSTPHVQNLFDDGSCRYYWVISSSRVVELTNGSNTQLGVLLVDMDYSGIARMMDRINTAGSGQYFYLCDSNGQIIYHPHQVQLDNGMKNESSKKAATAKESVYEERVNGERREIVVDTIGYTGWKLVCVMPYSIFSSKMLDIKQFVLILILLMAMMLTLINRLISVRISRPIMKLNNSVTEYEEGKESEIYIGGSREIRHLGRSIRKSYKQNTALMQKIVWEQTERRKSELEVLQSQINPHFLYNTLETIRMKAVVNHQPEIVELVKMLAKTMRYNIQVTDRLVTLKEELQMVGYYLKIQEYRFGDRIKSELIIDPEVDGKAYILPLTIQPFVENAFVHGLEQKENDGRLTVQVYRKEQEIYIEIKDNGCGMDYYELGRLRKTMRDESGDDTHIGVRNVSQRIRILYGSKYGVEVDSTKDLGTKVLIHIPYQTENPQNVEFIG